MKKKVISSVLVASLFTLPFSAVATTSTNLIDKEIATVTTNQSSWVTTNAFLEQAVTKLSYQHGSDFMRKEVLNALLKGADWQNIDGVITQEQIANVLVNKLGVEKKVKVINLLLIN